MIRSPLKAIGANAFHFDAGLYPTLEALLHAADRPFGTWKKQCV